MQSLMTTTESIFRIPGPIRTFYSYFPLHSYPPITTPNSRPVRKPTLWILPPRNPADQLLSSDVECLKWQAYLALRGFHDIEVRWDIPPDGGIDGRLPNLHVPISLGEKDGGGGELLVAHNIPGWVDKTKGGEEILDGYKDEAARDESHAWVSLLEGKVHAALVCKRRLCAPRIYSCTRLSQVLSQPQPSFLNCLLYSEVSAHGRSLSTLLSPPPAPLSGISSFLPPSGSQIPVASIELQYNEAISSLSERLSTDRWFLGSE